MINESNYIRIILLLADTQAWLNKMQSQLIHDIQPSAKKLFSNKNYRLSITAFAHIIERHFYKILRHPDTGKFNISIAEILDLVKETAATEAVPMKGSHYSKRTLAVANPIGFNKNGEPAAAITVITDQLGNIITAYTE